MTAPSGPEWGDKIPGDLKPEWGRSRIGDLTDAWPKTETGEPVTPAYLTKCSSVDMADQMLISMLEAYGIPCLTRYPYGGGFGKVVLGMPGFGVEIYVPETMLDDAVQLMQSDIDPEGEFEDEL